MNYQHVIDFIRSLFTNRALIPLHEPYFGGNEKKYLADCVDSTFVSSVGKYVDRFEEMMIHDSKPLIYTNERSLISTNGLFEV